MRDPERGWGLVLPVKPLAAAKSRLRGAHPGVPHARLVLALAQDTVRAALACPVVAAVLVVTDDPEVAGALGALGARVWPDAPAAGLNPALDYGARMLAGAGPGTGARRIGALAADLPALRPDELAAALDAAAGTGRRAFVPDADGTGTTLLAAPPGVALDPRFGPDSAARHAASGAVRLVGDWPTVRRDADTAADLAAAVRLGVGPHTAAQLRTGEDPGVRGRGSASRLSTD